MDKAEAYKIIQDELHEYEKVSYSELVSLIGKEITSEMRGKTSKLYQLEVQVFWDGKPNENVRVIGSIDDSNWYVFSPLTESFIMSPSGELI